MIINDKNYINLKVGDLLKIESNHPISKIFECDVCQVNSISKKINGEVIITTDNDLIMPLCLTPRVTVSKLENFKKVYELGEEEVLRGENIVKILRAKRNIKILDDLNINKKLDTWYINMCNKLRKDFGIKNYLGLAPITDTDFGVITFDAYVSENSNDIKKIYIESNTNKLFILIEEKENISENDSRT